MSFVRSLTAFGCLLAVAASCRSAVVFVEAESFENHGGWKLDTQFIEIMGSPYLLAHGLGRPVEDATTTVELPHAGTWRVLARTKDWVARWKAPGAPGRFQVLVSGKPAPETFGTKGAQWHWQNGGSIEIAEADLKEGKATLTLKDLTGFDGRCDAIILTDEPDLAPPNSSEPFAPWRKELLGLPKEPTEEGPFDLVVVGGGYAGMAAAISAARMGCDVALIQNRPVLGGNGSSEVRVWANGLIRRGRFPRIGEIVEEFMDHARSSPGTKEMFGDAKKEEVVQAEKKIALFLNHHGYKVETRERDGTTHITAVWAFDTCTGQQRRFAGKLFCDATGHGTIGVLAGAKSDMTMEKHMGMSNMWVWKKGDEPVAFPETPWALDLDMGDFPYPRYDAHGNFGKAEWFWETGFDKHPIDDLEYMRDWNLRAAYGAFDAMKNRGGADEHQTAQMVWLAYIGGPRESRRLIGDVILTREDIITKKQFQDGCVPSTWSIDLHYPKQQYMKKYPEDPFISKAVFDRRVDRENGYPVPYRCFYSVNVPNLFMAGRNISVTHEALGTVRVMNTLGMVGEVVGKAASICVKHDCLPRDVYTDHLPDLFSLLELPGKARQELPR